MSWRNVKLIFFREVLDQLRDRRTLFMVAVLPLLLYPLMGIGMFQMMAIFSEQPRTVVILGADELPDLPLLDGDQFARTWFRLSTDADKLRVISDSPSSMKKGRTEAEVAARDAVETGAGNARTLGREDAARSRARRCTPRQATR